MRGHVTVTGERRQERGVEAADQDGEEDAESGVEPVVRVRAHQKG